jgi:hypothetical protein
MLLSAALADASSCLQISVCDAYLRKDIPLIFRGEVIEVEPAPRQSPSASESEQSSPIRAVVILPETDSVHFAIREWLKGKRQDADITVVAQRGTYQVGKSIWFIWV